MPKLTDSNVWLALTLSKHACHRVSREWFDRMKPGDPVLFCRSTQQSYLRLLTTAEVLAPYGVAPLSNAKAWTVYEEWFDSECVAFMDEPRGLDAYWKRFAARQAPAPKLWMDAYLAAFATAGGCQLVTTDHGFKQYKGLDLQVLVRS